MSSPCLFAGHGYVDSSETPVSGHLQGSLFKQLGPRWAWQVRVTYDAIWHANKDSQCYQNSHQATIQIYAHTHTHRPQKKGTGKSWPIHNWNHVVLLNFSLPGFAGCCRKLDDRSNQNHRMMLVLFRLMINVSKRSLATHKDVLASWV